MVGTVTMKRGYNSIFYFAQRSGESDCVVNELKLHVVNGEWKYDIVEIFKVNEGTIINIQMDSENRKKTDSIYKNNRKLIEKRKEVLNRLFIIDDKENMFHLQ